MATQGNTILIKHGNGKPQNQDGTSKLETYELGFDYTNKILYINNGTEEETNKTLPIGADMSTGLSVDLGGTGSTNQAGAFVNIVAPGGTILKPLKLGGTDSAKASPGIFVLNENYSYGTTNPNTTKPITTPEEGHLYFMLID